MRLQRLGATGRRLVTRELASGQLDAHPHEAWTPHCEALERDHALDALCERLAQLRAEIAEHSSELDAPAPPR